MARLLALFLLLSILPLAAIGYIVYDTGRQSIITNVEAHLESVAILKQQEIENWVENLKNTVTYLASNPERHSDIAVLASHAVTDPEYLAAHESLVAEFKRIATFADIPEVFLLDHTSGQIIVASDPA